MKYKVLDKLGNVLPHQNFYLKPNGDLCDRDGRDGSITPVYGGEQMFVYTGIGDHYVGENGVEQHFTKDGEILTRTKKDILDELLHHDKITQEDYDTLC